MKKRIINGLKWTLIYTVLTLVFIEVLLWIVGYRPYSNEDYKVDASPGNPYVADAQLGIRLNPGTFTITLNNAVTFTATHQQNGERKIPGNPAENSPEVLFLGCSYTYGYGVNDDASFPAIVQQKHPEWAVHNAAVVGYGTVQHLLQLKKRLEHDPPDAVVLSLSSVHFQRTVLAQQYRANLRIGYRRSSHQVDNSMEQARFPFMTDCHNVQYADWESLYTEIPGRYWSATANFLQIQYDRAADPDCDPVEVTRCIIQQMHDLCKKQHIPFGIICLDKTQETVQLEKGLKDVPWKNIGFSFKHRRYTHLPHDSHPNEKGHRKIAGSVLPFLETLMSQYE